MESINIRKGEAMSKTDNMLAILWLLKTRKRITGKQLAEELEINIRTVYRYIDSLCASGVPIIADAGHNGGYSLLDQTVEAPLFFNIDEQKALIHATMFAKEAGYPFEKSLTSAVNKLKIYTNKEQLAEINRHLEGFDVINANTSSSIETTLQELEMAVAHRKTLLVTYQKGEKQTVISRFINPYGIIHWNNRWYVVAYCQLREEVRSFRVDRMKALERTISEFEIPKGFSSREFFLNSIKGDFENNFPTMNVQIQGKEQAINELSEHWLFSEKIIKQTNTHIKLKLNEKVIHSFLPYILIQYGKSLTVVEPSILKKRLVEITAGLLEYYQEQFHEEKNC